MRVCEDIVMYAHGGCGCGGGSGDDDGHRHYWSPKCVLIPPAARARESPRRCRTQTRTVNQPARRQFWLRQIGFGRLARRPPEWRVALRVPVCSRPVLNYWAISGERVVCVRACACVLFAVRVTIACVDSATEWISERIIYVLYVIALFAK